MPENSLHPAALAREPLLAECDVARTKRSGPGGQHRNKVETAIVLTHRPTGTRVEASESRSQADNLARAVWRLRLELALTHRLPAPSEEASQFWKERFRGGPLSIRTDHADFPAILAEALDRIAGHGFDLSAAAQTLATTQTQLVRLLAQEPRALAEVNHERRQRQLRPLQG